jgi:HEAT repeat protein
VDQLLEEFLRATEFNKLIASGVSLSSRDDPDDVPVLFDALRDKVEARRWAAVYALGFTRRDRRAVVPLMNTLLDRNETVWVRSQAAECLGYLHCQRAIKVLIRCSRDPSSDLRFWCVFGLGQVARPPRKRDLRGQESGLLRRAFPIWPDRAREDGGRFATRPSQC